MFADCYAGDQHTENINTPYRWCQKTKPLVLTISALELCTGIFLIFQVTVIISETVFIFHIIITSKANKMK